MAPPSPETKKATSPLATKASAKNTKPTKVVTLKISSYLLTKFPYEEEPEAPPAKSKSAQQSASDATKASTSLPSEKNDQSNLTSNPSTKGDGDAATNKDTKRKGIPGPKPGTKRSAPATEPDGTPKPRGKPGPKKRKVDGENGAPAPAPAPKLGPKANTGAINAQLRALDRTGKPCRRWGKRTIALKSFTGVAWDLPYWQTPKLRRDDLTNDAQSQDTSSSDAKNEPASSQVASEKSNGLNESTNGLARPVGLDSPSADPTSTHASTGNAAPPEASPETQPTEA